MSRPPIAPEWQQPYVNVFKLCGVDTLKEFERIGDVAEHMDRIIGKKVFKIRGLIPAANYLRVPRLKAENLGLTGRFLYMQLKVSPVKVFVAHLELVTEDQIVHRVSISSMYKEEALRRKSNGIQIPFPHSSHRWCIAAVDMAGALSKFTTSPFHCLKSVQLCSWLTVRSIYTSDMKFSLQTLPPDMALSHALDSSAFEYIWLPREPKDVKDADIMPATRRVNEKVPLPTKKSPGASGKQAERQSPRDPGHIPPPTSPTTAQPPIPAVYTVSANAKHFSTKAKELAAHIANKAMFLAQADAPQGTGGASGQAGAGSPVAQLSKGTGPELGGTVHSPVLEPDPVLTLTRVNAYTGEFTRTVVWPPHSNEVVFTAGSVVVAMREDSSSAVAGSGPAGAGVAPNKHSSLYPQRFFLGHTSHVVAVAFDAEGAIMATAQDGRQAVIRVWDFRAGTCVAILNGHASGMVAVDVSADGRALLGVGLDAQSRQLAVLWDISGLRTGGKPEVVTRHVTEYNIKAAKFSAYEEDHLVTCGRDNVRMYRLKNGALRGVTVRTGAPDKRVTSFHGGLAAALGPNIFTDIAFESTAGVYAPEGRRVYVSSASGSVFEIDYATRMLLCVYQLHSAAINSLVVFDGFCVTGSDDRQLRVWPMDFSDFLLEAEHEAGVTSVAVAPDGLRVAIGTESGALGVLDIPSHHYTTLLRSHVGRVNGVVADPVRDEYCTVSSDGTIRIWDLHTHKQLVEFDAPGEVATCAAYHPRHYELSVGFANGRVRVFDIATTTLVQEHLQHKAEVVQALYSPDGARLYTAGADGGLCVYDVAQVYMPVKFLSAGQRDLKVCAAVSADGRYLATVAQDPHRHITSLLLFHGATLEPYMRIETDTTAFKRLAFSGDGSELWAVAAPNRLDRYELFEGQLLQQVSQAHRLDINTLAADPAGHFVVTGGNDGLVKVWGCTPRGAPNRLTTAAVPPHQAFGGHPSAVLGAAVKGSWLITVGDAESIFVWRINSPGDVPAQPQHKPAQKGHQAGKGSKRPPSAGAAGLSQLGAHITAPSVASIKQWSPAEPAATLLAPDGSSAAREESNRQGLSGPGQQVPSAPRAAWGAGSETTVIDLTAPSALAAAGRVPPQGMSPANAVAMSGALAAGATDPPGNLPAPLQPSPLPAVVVSPGSSNTNSGQSAQGAGRQSVSNASEGSPAWLPVVSPGPESVIGNTSVTFPASRPTCTSILGYTPSATAQNVVWVPSTALFAYAVDHVVVVEDLATHTQNYLAHLTRPVSAIAVSPDSRLLAAAPGSSEVNKFAGVVVWDVASGAHLATLEYHPIGVEALAFSPDGRHLVSVGRDPERTVVVWDVGPLQDTATSPQQPQPAPQQHEDTTGGAKVVAVGRSRSAMLGVCWIHSTSSTDAAQAPSGQAPLRFATVGGDGLLLWTLRPTHLEQMPIPLSPGATHTPSSPSSGATAVAADPRGGMIATAGDGTVWEVGVLDAQQSVALRQVADVRGSEVTRITVSEETAVLGTLGGVVARFSRGSSPGAVWERGPELHLDGAVTALCVEPSGMAEAVVATASSTVWYLNVQESWQVPLVAGHTATITSLSGARPAPGSSLRAGAAAAAGLVASTAEDGALRVWHVGKQVEPVVEYQSPPVCTCAALVPPQHSASGHSSPAHGSPRHAHSHSSPHGSHPRSAWAAGDGSEGDSRWRVVGGYEDGTLRLFSVPAQPQGSVRGSAPAAGGQAQPQQQQEAGLQWTSSRHQAPVVSVIPHPHKPVVLSASSDGGLAVTGLATSRLEVYLEHFVPGSQQQLLQMSEAAAALAQAEQQQPASGRQRGVLPDEALCGVDVSGEDATVCAGAWRSYMVVFSTPWNDSLVRMIALYKCEESVGRLSHDVPAIVRFVPQSTKHVAYSSPLLLGKVLLFDYRLAAVTRSIAVPQMVRSLAASPNGQLLALGGTGGSVFLAETDTGRSVELTGHLYPLTALHFTPNSKRLLSAGASTMLLWALEGRLERPKAEVLRSRIL